MRVVTWTVVSGGEKASAFSRSSASRWATSATDSPVSSWLASPITLTR